MIFSDQRDKITNPKRDRSLVIMEITYIEFLSEWEEHKLNGLKT